MSDTLVPPFPKRKVSCSGFEVTRLLMLSGADWSPWRYPFNQSGPAHVLLHAESKAPTRRLSSASCAISASFVTEWASSSAATKDWDKGWADTVSTSWLSPSASSTCSVFKVSTTLTCRLLGFFSEDFLARPCPGFPHSGSPAQCPGRPQSKQGFLAVFFGLVFEAPSEGFM